MEMSGRDRFNKETWIADIADEGMRLDVYLADLQDGISRSYLQKLIKEEQVLINGKPTKCNYRLVGTEEITLTLPDPEASDILPEQMDLDILYEDDDLIFINKPKGMVVHPAPGHSSGTLVNGLLYHCGESLSGINGVQRPGIVHRIDRDTTGVIVACKNDFTHTDVARQLAEHSITRRYEAIVHGVIEQNCGSISEPIARNRHNRLKMAVDPMHGKRAVTHYEVLHRSDRYTHVECRLETGRTHQIRVHMSYLHHPLLGDVLYGAPKSPFKLEGQTLHAGVLGLVHPRTKEYLEIKAPLPSYFQKLLDVLY